MLALHTLERMTVILVIVRQLHFAGNYSSRAVMYGGVCVCAFFVVVSIGSGKTSFQVETMVLMIQVYCTRRSN